MVATSTDEFEAGYFEIPADIYETDKFKTKRNNLETIKANTPRRGHAGHG